MALKSRLDLKGYFQDGKKLSSSDFTALIDSTLNKYDDCFMGKWKPGVSYRRGDVVIYDHALWQLEPKDDSVQEICSQSPPGDETPGDWVPLESEVKDDDWVFFPETGVMYAKVFRCVGIGRLFEDREPEAKLEIVEGDQARYLIFPKSAAMPTLSLFQMGENDENTYFITGLNDEALHFLTDAPAGYLFRRGEACEPGDETTIDPKEGDVLMVVKPDVDGMARVGISTANPLAMLDITDRRKGQFLFNPQDKDDPAFSILNLDPKCDKNYVAMGVGQDHAVLVTDAHRGFLFKHGHDYGDYCAATNINQGDSLVAIRWNDHREPRVGIGTETPAAMLDVTDGHKGRFLLNPEDKNDPAFTIINLHPGNKKNYLTSGVGSAKAVFVTDAPKGFTFNRGNPYDDFAKGADINQGTALVVILRDGKVGIGTETPDTRLEITDQQSGRFRFNLDDKKPNPSLSIVNTRQHDNYFVLGADNTTAVLSTDSTDGFVFKQGGPAGTNDNELDINQGEPLFRLSPEKDRKSGGTTPPEAVFFPPGKNKNKGRVGIRRTPGEYDLDLNGLMRTYNAYFNTDETSLDKEQPLAQFFKNKPALARILALKPIAFEWDPDTGLDNEGKQIGLKAQDVLDIIPEVVRYDEMDRTHSVAYQNLVPVLIQAIHELSDQVKALRQEVQQMKGEG